MSDAQGWRPLIAALANPDTRRVAARLMLGDPLETAAEGLPPSKRRRAAEALTASGLLADDGETLDPQVFRRLLDAAAAPRRTGRERFVDGTRIRQYPASATDRRELLAWVARRVFAVGEVLDEREVNERLLAYSDDVALLRRHLVDHGLVERGADGSGYTLADGVSAGR
jgi:hypothetical protein